MTSIELGRARLVNLFACQTRFALVEKQYIDLLYALLEEAQRIALDFATDTKAWKIFIDHEFWRGSTAKPRPCDRKAALHFVLAFVTRSHSGEPLTQLTKNQKLSRPFGKAERHVPGLKMEAQTPKRRNRGPKPRGEPNFT